MQKCDSALELWLYRGRAGCRKRDGAEFFRDGMIVLLSERAEAKKKAEC